MTDETKTSPLDIIKRFLADLSEDDQFGPIVAAITPFLPTLITMGKAAIERFVKLIIKGSTDEAQDMVFQAMTPEEREPILRAAMHKMNKAAIASAEMSQEALNILLKVLIALLPLAL